MEPDEIRNLIAKIIMCLFGAFLFFTYIQRNTPGGGFGEISVFLMTFFMNFGTQWWLYKLQALSNTVMQYVCIVLQLGFFWWTIYDFRFVYYAHMERNYEVFINTPLQQYVPIFALFVTMLILKTRGT